MRIKRESWSTGTRRVAALVLSFSIAGSTFAAAAYDGTRPPAASSSTASARPADVAFRKGSDALQHHDLKAAEFQFAKVVRLSPGSAAGHSAYGSVLLSLGKLLDAIHELELALRIDPAEPSAMINLAYAYQQDGKVQSALALYDSVAATPGYMSPEAYVRNAELLITSGDLAKAKDRVQQGARAYPQSSLLQDSLGIAQTKQQDYPAAVAAFRKAILLNPGSGKAYLHLGSLFILLGQHDDALPELTLAVKLIPNDAETHLQLGYALSTTGDATEGIAELQKAHALAPSSIAATYALAVALQKTGRNQQALPLFETAVEAHPQDVGMLTNLGLDLVQLGRAKEGLRVYEQALPLSAHDWVLQQNIGVAYLQQNDLDHAIQHFTAALAIEPDNAQLHYDLGLAYKLKDKLPEAIAALRTAENEDPSLSDAPYTLGVLLMQAGQFTDAESELQKATVLMPGNGDAWSARASVDKSLGHYDLAVDDYKMAIRTRPEDAGNHINLAAILAQQGKHSDALAERKIGAELTRALMNKQKSTFAVSSARTLLEKGNIEDAMSELSSAIAADPTNAEAHLAMADAFSRQGRTTDAALERQKAHALASP